MKPPAIAVVIALSLSCAPSTLRAEDELAVLTQQPGKQSELWLKSRFNEPHVWPLRAPKNVNPLDNSVHCVSRHYDWPELVKLAGKKVTVEQPVDPNGQRVSVNKNNARNSLRLFVDDGFVERSAGLKRKIHQPKDIGANPVLKPEHPWEHRRITSGSVYWIPEERKFKCWYVALNIYDSRPGFRGYRKQFHVPIKEATFICYAESKDGVKWTKPNLGLHEYRGSKDNNILLTCPGTHFDSTSVIYLPHDRQWPYRMMTFIGRWPYREDQVKKQWGDPPPFEITRHGHYAFGSKDGIHWRELNNNQPVLRASDRSMFWWDPQKQIFVGSAKRSHVGKRAQAYAWSRDMIDWAITNEWIHRVDEKDHVGDEGEAAYGFPYGSQWLGFAEMRRERKSQTWKETKINWELLSSPDGRKWTRPIREHFFSDAGKESWRFQVLKVMSNPPIERDDRMLIYYSGKTGTVPLEQGYAPFQAICLATLRKDGFVSLSAGKQVGEVVTKPFVASGDQLLVNVDVRESGEARIEILDEHGKPIQGFGLQDSLSLRGHSAKQRASWRGGANWSQLAGQTVRLRFSLRNADLYAVWTASESS